MHPSDNNFLDNFRRNPLPYIVGAIILLVAFPLVLRIGFAVFGVAFIVAGTAMGTLLGVLGAIFLLAVRFIWLIAIMAIIWWVVNRRPSRTVLEKRKNTRAEPLEDLDYQYHYDENGDAYFYEDELFDAKRKRSR